MLCSHACTDFNGGKRKHCAESKGKCSKRYKQEQKITGKRAISSNFREINLTFDKWSRTRPPVAGNFLKFRGGRRRGRELSGPELLLVGTGKAGVVRNYLSGLRVQS